jgi:hypothetical protein
MLELLYLLCVRPHWLSSSIDAVLRSASSSSFTSASVSYARRSHSTINLSSSFAFLSNHISILRYYSSIAERYLSSGNGRFLGDPAHGCGPWGDLFRYWHATSSNHIFEYGLSLTLMMIVLIITTQRNSNNVPFNSRNRPLDRCSPGNHHTRVREFYASSRLSLN